MIHVILDESYRHALAYMKENDINPHKAIVLTSDTDSYRAMGLTRDPLRVKVVDLLTGSGLPTVRERLRAKGLLP